MKASNILIRDLDTFESAYNAIESIQSDYRNYIGGLSAWDSGRQVYLNSTAEKKIKSIKRFMNRVQPAEEV